MKGIRVLIVLIACIVGIFLGMHLVLGQHPLVIIIFASIFSFIFGMIAMELTEDIDDAWDLNDW